MQGDGTISFKHPLSVSWACGGVAGGGAAGGETPGLREDAPAPATPPPLMAQHFDAAQDDHWRA